METCISNLLSGECEDFRHRRASLRISATKQRADARLSRDVLSKIIIRLIN
jgi:hypothetical protein